MTAKTLPDDIHLFTVTTLILTYKTEVASYTAICYYKLRFPRARCLQQETLPMTC